MERDGETVSLFVDEAGSRTRPTPRRPAPSATPRSPRPSSGPARRSSPRSTAASATPSRSPTTSRHARHPAAEGDPDAPDCLDCHGKHDTQEDDPASPTFARNVPGLCAQCHRDGEQAAVRIETEARRHRRQLRRQHPRQGAARERPAGHGDLRRLPQRPRRAAARRRALDGPPRQRRRHLRLVPPRHRGDLQDEHPLARRTAKTDEDAARPATTATPPTPSRARPDDFRFR